MLHTNDLCASLLLNSFRLLFTKVMELLLPSRKRMTSTHTLTERKPRWRERCVLESTKAKHAVKDVQNNDLDAILYCVALIRHNSFEFSMLLLWLHTWNVRFAVFVWHEYERTAKNHRTTLLTSFFPCSPFYVIYWLVMASYCLCHSFATPEVAVRFYWI